MTQRSFVSRAVAVLAIAALSTSTFPVSASDAGARLTGSVLSGAESQPLVGAKLHAGDPKTGEVFTSGVTGDDGAFEIADLPASTYELAVEADGGLYVVTTPVRLAPGQSETLQVAVNPQMAPDPEEAAAVEARHTRASLWNNPLTAALIVLGAALVLGVVIDSATDDDDDLPASPSSI